MLQSGTAYVRHAGSGETPKGFVDAGIAVTRRALVQVSIADGTEIGYLCRLRPDHRVLVDAPQEIIRLQDAFEMSGWFASKAPVARLEFVHEQSVVARCELDVSRPDVATEYGSSSQAGFWKPIGTAGLAPAFTAGVSLGVDPLENQYGIG